jgi:site-specific recombinase XerD
MAMSDILRLQDALPKLASRSFTRTRNGSILTLLMESGVRRSELKSITLDGLRSALTTGLLEVRNSKRDDRSRRQIPVDRDALEAVQRYVVHQRAMQMGRNRQKQPAFKDPGWLLCKSDGSQISDTSVTKLFSLLRRMAGITSRAHPNMLRHRWITLQLVRMLEEMQELGGIAADLLVTLLTRLASISGHSSNDSLWTYVHFASEEMQRISREGQPRVVSRSEWARLCSLLDELVQLHAGTPISEEMIDVASAIKVAMNETASRRSKPILGLTARLR